MTFVFKISFLLSTQLTLLFTEDPPEEEEEEEGEVEPRRVKFDRRNPWGEVAEEWVSSVSRTQREYPVDLDQLDKPPRM